MNVRHAHVKVRSFTVSNGYMMGYWGIKLPVWTCLIDGLESGRNKEIRRKKREKTNGDDEVKV